MPAEPQSHLGPADGSGLGGLASVTQPFLHDAVTCVRAPSTLLSGPDGQVRVGGVHGWFRHDLRRLSEMRIMLGRPESVAVVTEPEAVGASLDEAWAATFAAVSRVHGEDVSDPTVYVERRRVLDADRLVETVVVTNHGRAAQDVVVRLRAAVDHAPVPQVKKGVVDATTVALTAAPDVVRWTSAAGVTSMVATPGPDQVAAEGDEAAGLQWRVPLPPGASWQAEVVVTAEDQDEPATCAAGVPSSLRLDSTSSTLERLVSRGVSDLDGLQAAFRDWPDEVFATAGSPWYLTLFGRDALWAARLALPLGTELAGGTLRALARLQGSRHDPSTAEQPGKILHEFRSGPGVAGHWLPPVYFGTVDATMLWVSLLHDAWRWGMPETEVRALLPNLHRALGWMLEHADMDGDGLVEYRDETGSGLANQAWKDSVDAVPHADGALAAAPLAMCEVQAYLVRACLDAADLLDALDPAASRGTALRDHARVVSDAFRRRFWVEDARGAFPAIALDAAKEPVATATSNLGHLPATGLLDPGEEALVAARIAQPDLDSGRGLRTLSAEHPRFNPVGYHTGSVWPHDTAIAVLGLARSGHDEVAASLATGLLSVSDHFSGRLPELFGGTPPGQPVVAYPASCRPQAWSAAAAVALLQTALGLEVDVPAGSLTVAPRQAFRAWLPLTVRGLRIGGRSVDIEVDHDGATRVRGAGDLQVRLGTGG